MRRRLVRHHLVIALLSAAGLATVHVATPSPSEFHRWSMATAYVGLALLVATLATGPVNVVRARPNPVSTDLRRDIGIWAGIVSIVHFLVGWQLHMKHRYLYWLREVGDAGRLVPRTDLFGFANYTGLLAVLIAVLLLVLSSDAWLRRLGSPRWKRLQRWNYALFALVVAHGIAFQVIETRKVGYLVVSGALLAGALVAQWSGYRATRRRREQRADDRERAVDIAGAA